MPSIDSDQAQFKRYKARMEAFLHRIRDALPAVLPRGTRIGAIEEANECRLTFRVRPSHRAQLDVYLGIVDRASLDPRAADDDSDRGVAGGLLFAFEEQVHGREDRPIASVIELTWLDYSDRDGWERKLADVEVLKEEVVSAIGRWVGSLPLR